MATQTKEVMSPAVGCVGDGIIEDKAVSTYDFASPLEQVEAIDQLMRQYFGAEHWLPIRNRLFPGLRLSL
jgi:hypothetical protein